MDLRRDGNGCSRRDARIRTIATAAAEGASATFVREATRDQVQVR